MIRQRAPGAAPVVRALAAALPFRDASFDAALAILTIHHWPERARGLAELARAARRRVVILTHDPTADGFWLEDYFPALFGIDRTILPSLDELRRAFGRVSVLRRADPARLPGWLPRRVLVPPRALPRSRRSRRDLELREARAGRARRGRRAPPRGPRLGGVGAPARRAPNEGRARPRLSPGRSGERVR